MALQTQQPIQYTVSVASLHAHLYDVRLEIAKPRAGQRLSLPVWIPGSYLVREFSRHLQQLQARQQEQVVALRQINKNTWELDCCADATVTVSYQVYAFDNSVRAAWLDADRGFFNPTSLCLRVHGQEALAHGLQIEGFPADWELATALHSASVSNAVNAQGFGQYIAQNYDELADSPVEMGRFWSGSFTAAGVPHRFVVAGASNSFDGERLLEDTRKICEAEMAFWHPDGSTPPHDRYVFMLNAVGNGYGGLEHRHSTALICNRSDLPRKGTQEQPDGYNTLLGLISHEYFHTWNVKRMRPAEFASYDYEQENYTELLWFFEGFTSYYDDLLLYRAGLLDAPAYLKVLGKTLQQVSQTPGRKVQNVAQASFDAWVKYYRQEENTLNTTVSYYTKGALVALCLDLTLRTEAHQATHQPVSLDDVLRYLWQQSGAGPITEKDVLGALEVLSGRSFAAKIEAWVHGTQELPVEELLAKQGVQLERQKPNWSQRLGILLGDTLQVRRILSGSAAEAAGLAVHDEWLGIEVDGQAWRIRKLDELAQYLQGEAPSFVAVVARDARLLRIPVSLPALDVAAEGEIRLRQVDGGVNQWLCLADAVV